MAKTLILEVYVPEWSDDCPYAVWEPQEQEVKRIEALTNLVEEHRLTEVREGGNPDRWGPEGLDCELRLTNMELCVCPNGFWFTATAKHSDRAYETKVVLLKTFREALASDEDIWFQDPSLVDVYAEAEREDEEVEA